MHSSALACSAALKPSIVIAFLAVSKVFAFLLICTAICSQAVRSYRLLDRGSVYTVVLRCDEAVNLLTVLD